MPYLADCECDPRDLHLWVARIICWPVTQGSIQRKGDGAQRNESSSDGVKVLDVDLKDLLRKQCQIEGRDSHVDENVARLFSKQIIE